MLDAMRGRLGRKYHFAIRCMLVVLSTQHVPSLCSPELNFLFKNYSPSAAFVVESGEKVANRPRVRRMMHDARGAEKPPDLLVRCMLPNGIACPSCAAGGP